MFIFSLTKYPPQWVWQHQVQPSLEKPQSCFFRGLFPRWEGQGQTSLLRATHRPAKQTSPGCCGHQSLSYSGVVVCPQGGCGAFPQRGLLSALGLPFY